jgi:hypothetical protein
MHETDRQSTPSLIGDAIRHATSLFSAEIQLVRLEATEKLTKVIASIVSLVVAAVFIIVALIFLLTGLVGLLAHVLHWPHYAVSFLVGGVVAVIAAVAIFVAIRNLSGSSLKPQRTLRQVQQTTDFVRSAR